MVFSDLVFLVADDDSFSRAALVVTRCAAAVLGLETFEELWAAQFGEVASLSWPAAPRDELTLAAFQAGKEWCARATAAERRRCGASAGGRPSPESLADRALRCRRPRSPRSKLVAPRRDQALGAIILGLRRSARTAPECRKLPGGSEMRVYYA